MLDHIRRQVCIRSDESIPQVKPSRLHNLKSFNYRDSVMHQRRKMSRSRTRIPASGAPSEVARLLDWLEDNLVLHMLHTRVLSSLVTTRDAQYPVIHRVAQLTRALSPSTDVLSTILYLHLPHRPDFRWVFFIQYLYIQCSVSDPR